LRTHPLKTDTDTLPNDTSESFSSTYSCAVNTGHGVYYKGQSGQTQAEQYRPIEPITAPQDMTQPSATELRLHGALVLSFSKNDISPFTAAISTPDLAPSSDQPVPHTTDATFPSSIVAP